MDVNKQLILPWSLRSFILFKAAWLVCPVLCNISSTQVEMLQLLLRNIPGCGKIYKWIGCHKFKLAPISPSFLLRNKSGTIALQEAVELEKQSILFNNYLSIYTVWHVRSPIKLFSYNLAKCPPFTQLQLLEILFLLDLILFFTGWKALVSSNCGTPNL